MVCLLYFINTFGLWLLIVLQILYSIFLIMALPPPPPPKFNKTHIVLIPKVKNPKKITQYRPISLSNVVSRLASKVLANRLKCFLPNIIRENQSAFMSNCLIIDNVLVAFETMHYIKQKKTGRFGEMALKLLIWVKLLIGWMGLLKKKLCTRWASMILG